MVRASSEVFEVALALDALMSLGPDDPGLIRERDGNVERLGVVRLPELPPIWPARRGNRPLAALAGH